MVREAVEQEQGNYPNRIQKAAERNILLPEESEIRSLENAGGKNCWADLRETFVTSLETADLRCETNSIGKLQEGKRQRATIAEVTLLFACLGSTVGRVRKNMKLRGTYELMKLLFIG